MLSLSARLFGVLLAVASVLMTHPTGEPAEVEHPSWCDPAECKVVGGGVDHRSTQLEIAIVGNEVTEVQSEMAQSTTGNGVVTVLVTGWSEMFDPDVPAGEMFEQCLVLSLRQTNLLAGHLAELVALHGGPDDPARTDGTEG